MSRMNSDKNRNTSYNVTFRKNDRNHVVQVSTMNNVASTIRKLERNKRKLVGVTAVQS